MLKELIERAEKAAGGQKQLALKIGQSESNIRGAKAGVRGLPVYACVMIADLIGEERITVIAASELITEKKEERRKVWSPFVKHAAALAGLTVILNMTPAPAEATPVLKTSPELCILCQMLRRAIKKARGWFAYLASDNPTTWTPRAGLPG